MKPQTLTKLTALLPSIFIALIHFRLSVLVGPQANAVFQRWFDTGEPASGADAAIQSVDRLLSLPIPALWFAKHPVYGLPPEWWVATILNSALWGLAIYACYVLPVWLLKRRGKLRALESAV